LILSDIYFVKILYLPYEENLTEFNIEAIWEEENVWQEIVKLFLGLYSEISGFISASSYEEAMAAGFDDIKNAEIDVSYFGIK